MPSGSALGGIDDTLVLRAQAGDSEATGELVTLARPILQRFARRFFPDPARAEDMAQTALMKAFARMGDLRSPEAFQTWLLRIARNECLNELTRSRVAQIPMSTLEDQGTALEAPAGGADDPEEMLVRSQMQDLVRRVTATLPEHYRATLTMRALEDRSYEEISEALDVPVTVARLWYCRARKRFRAAFIQTLVARRDVSDECQEMGSLIAEMIEGTLGRARRDVVQSHLVDCAACRQTEDELRNTAFRAPARVLLFAIGLARVPMHLRRASATVAERVQQMGAELAIGAGATMVLVTGSGFGGLGSSPLTAQAAGPSSHATLAYAPSLASSGTAGPAHYDAVTRTWRDSAGAPVAVAVAPPMSDTSVSLLPATPDAPVQSPLPVKSPVQAPALPTLPQGTAPGVPAAPTASLASTLALLPAMKMVPLALPVLSR
ncbi:MAG TPA: sigma-70 family RNA polymerase sigma factor [Candidatus Dormibacteraeota bacterium]|jgi:RNA polymerase sigma-70 factor (ECF subfamily)|nr:sigma-70 family RNA polymerase sigma factor [Candidatus Dormibacteraeota bacterium]